MIAQKAEAHRTKTVAVGYLRRSTDRQEQSIPDQKKAIQKYVDDHHLSLAKFYVDDAISGTSSVGRKAFQEMIADAQRAERPFNLIVVYDVKRFGRVDNDEAGYYRHVLRLHGVEVCYVSENFNGDGTDDLLRPVKQWQAREESKDLSKVTIRGLLSKVEGGWWMGGVPPHGYDLRYENAEGKFLLVLRHRPDGSKQVLDEKGGEVRTLARGESLSISKRDRAKLVLSEPHRYKAVREIFRLYVNEGRGFKAIADALNRRKVPTPRGSEWAAIYSGHWTDTTIRAILVNPIYTGNMVWNRRTDGRFHRIENNRATPRQKVHAARLEPNDPGNWITIRNCHPELVSHRLFEQAKQTRQSRPTSNQRQHVTGGWHGTRSRFILSGLIKCAHCGNRYQGFTRQKGERRKDGSLIKNFYYGCGGYITKGSSVCQLGSIAQEKLESGIKDAVLKVYEPYLSSKGKKQLAEVIRKQLVGESDEVAKARKKADQWLAKIGKTISNLLDDITAANRELIDRRLVELSKERDGVQTQLEQFNNLTLSQPQVQAMIDESMKSMAKLSQSLRSGVFEEQRAALRQCVLAVSVDGKSNTVKITVHQVPGSINHNATQDIQITL